MPPEHLAALAPGHRRRPVPPVPGRTGRAPPGAARRRHGPAPGPPWPRTFPGGGRMLQVGTRQGWSVTMGLMRRFSNIFKAKASKTLDKYEDPRETLDYSYERTLEM